MSRVALTHMCGCTYNHAHAHAQVRVHGLDWTIPADAFEKSRLNLVVVFSTLTAITASPSTPSPFPGIRRLSARWTEKVTMQALGCQGGVVGWREFRVDTPLLQARAR